MSFLAFALIGIFVSRPFFASQTTIGEVREYGTVYLTICCTASIGIFMQMAFERLLQSTGKTIYAMITQGAGAVTNLILDPILIFGLLGFPAMGVAGAAAATVIGQIVAAALAIVFNLKCNKELHISFHGFKPDLGLIGNIYKVGIPSIVMQAIGSVMTYGMNLILISFTSTATAVFGVYFKLQSFVFMPVFGLNNGVIPIVAYNYGAQKGDRVMNAIKLSILYAVSIMVVGFLVLQIAPKPLLLWFEASETMLSIGIPALRTISISFILAGFCIACGSVFQALGCSIYSMFVSVARQLVVLLPAAYLLSRLGNVNLVWWAFPIAELMSLAMTAFFMAKVYRDIISKIIHS